MKTEGIYDTLRPRGVGIGRVAGPKGWVLRGSLESESKELRDLIVRNASESTMIIGI